jgi:PPOX class probable F420-dependent enzyme
MVQLADNVRHYLEEVRLAVFGSTNRDGSPHLTGLWYMLRDDTIVLSTVTPSRKVSNLRRDPRASVCVIDHQLGRHVTVNGSITFDDQHVLEDLITLASRYVGPEAGPGLGERISGRPHVTMLLSIDSLHTFGNV